MGVFLSLLAVIFGVLTGVLIKKLGSDINIITTLFYRFLFSLPILFLYAIYLRGRDFLQINQRRILFFRSLLGLCGITFYQSGRCRLAWQQRYFKVRLFSSRC
jgi:drug/metabolite transporter (DMT)-like permease